jgi:hypothetical protein
VDQTGKRAAWLVLGAAFLLLAALNILFGTHWLDSDMAAEMIFSKLLLDEREFLATGQWYYSTEFRVLYTQLLMEPLFLLSGSWRVVRVLTNLLTYVLLLGSFFYLMKPFRIEPKTVVWTSVLLLLPFSETVATHVQMGNTYMPHMILLFFYFGMFLRLAERGCVWRPSREAGRGSVGKRIGLPVCFLLLSVVCGLSGVRYLLALQAPMLVSAAIDLRKTAEPARLRQAAGERLSYLVVCLAGLFGALVGYGLNVTSVTKRYSFQTYETTNFVSVYQGVFLERVRDTFGSLLMLFGYIPDRGFLSLRGLVTMAAFGILGVIVFITVRCGRLLGESGEGEPSGAYTHRRFLLYFFQTSLILHTFVLVFTTGTIVPRYYITVFQFALPLLAVYYQEEKSVLDRWLALAALCGCMVLATGKTVYSFVTTDKNQERKEAAAYLTREGYEFGYATYWNANILQELTDGKVEVANVSDWGDFGFFYWSTPRKYYEASYHRGKTFLLLTAEEAERYREEALVRAGRLVYEDENFQVLHFDSCEEVLGFRK